MSTLTLSHWLTKSDAAARLQISERTLDRLCEKGEGPERRNRPRQGQKPEPVYNPDDVDRLAAPKAYVMPAETSEVARKPESQIARQPVASDVLSQVLDRIAGAVEGRLQPPALFLTLPEARVYSGLSLALLRRLVNTGELPSLLDGSRKVRRVDLDNFVSISPKRGSVAKLAKSTSAGRD